MMELERENENEGLATLPDHLLTELFLRIESATDRTKLATVCRHFRHLSHSQNSIWRRFRSVKIWSWMGQIRITSRPDDSVIFDCHFNNNDGDERLCKLRSVFDWLFKYAKPKQLRLDVSDSDTFHTLISTLPSGCQLPVERLKLVLPQLRRHCSTDLEILLKVLPPTSLTHLHLEIDGKDNAHLEPILSNYLCSATKLHTLWAGIFVWGVSEKERPAFDRFMHNLRSLPQLKLVYFNQQIDLLNRIVSNSIQHLCCAVPSRTLWDCCLNLSETARRNINSIGCVWLSEGHCQLSSLPRLFPNCRRIEFHGQTSSTNLRDLCAAYRRENLNLDPKNESDWLKITVFVWHLQQPSVEFGDLTEIRRVGRLENNCCAIRREFH